MAKIADHKHGNSGPEMPMDHNTHSHVDDAGYIMGPTLNSPGHKHLMRDGSMSEVPTEILGTIRNVER